MRPYNEEVIVADLSALNKLFLLVPEATKKEIALHLKLIRGEELDNTELENGVHWMNRLLQRNNDLKVYESCHLRQLFENVLTVAIARKYIGTEAMPDMSRTTLINTLIQKFSCVSYLEIGVSDPEANFDLITCKNKQGVDPFPLRTDIIAMTSDDYFAGLDKAQRFDLVFIDGLHHYDQVIRDIDHALAHLAPGGTIVCHDMLPVSEESQRVPRETREWTGDCWKAWAHFRMNNPELDMQVVDTDYGVGVIRKGKQQLFRPSVNLDELNYDFFTRHRKELMNTVSVRTFVASLQLTCRHILDVLQIMNITPFLQEEVAEMLTAVKA